MYLEKTPYVTYSTLNDNHTGFFLIITAANESYIQLKYILNICLGFFWAIKFNLICFVCSIQMFLSKIKCEQNV